MIQIMYNGRSDGDADSVGNGFDEMNELYQYADLLKREKMVIL